MAGPALTTAVATGTPYQLNPVQVAQASAALLTHIKAHAVKKEQGANKKNLLADADEDAAAEQLNVPIWLTVGTKKHILDQTKLKPTKVALPNPMQEAVSKICLITCDPQRAYKDLKEDPAFPTELATKITRVVGVNKLKTKYKSYEAKRQLQAEYDVFLCDDRISSSLPSILGKVFYKGNSKRPLPVDLTAGANRADKKAPVKESSDKAARARVVGTPKAVAHEIEKALNCTSLNMSSSTNLAIKVGHSGMTSKQINENVTAVVSTLTEKFIPKGFRGVRSVHIKGPNTMALPIWLADELWTGPEDVLEEKWTAPIKDGVPHENEKKRKWDEWEEELLDDDEKKEKVEKKARSRKGRKPRIGEDGEEAERTISNKKARRKLKQDALKSVQAAPAST